MTQTIVYKAYHFFCCVGGSAKGWRRGTARVGNLQAVWRNIGGCDVDAAAVRFFDGNAGCPGTVVDLFSRDQYEAFHGHAPPQDWREATPDDIRRSAGYEFPDAVFLSPPCKGYSGLLPEQRSKTDKYQALNALALRGVFLMMEAWKDDPPALVFLENVPRIASRGRGFLDRLIKMMQGYGYAHAETTHNCGKIGNLHQSRERYLLVFRHMGKVPNFLYEPPMHRLRPVGELLDKLPLPGDPFGGAMHRIPALQFKTWIRLAMIEAGSDWRSLQKLRVENGVLKDYGIVPDDLYRNGVLGVGTWSEPAGTITSQRGPLQGKFAVADPRTEAFNGGYGVTPWDANSGTVTGEGRPVNGNFSVADPRVDGHPKSVQLGVGMVDQPAATVTGKGWVGCGRNAIADPRVGHGPAGAHFSNVYRVIRWSDHASAVTAGNGPSSGGNAVADPRPAQREDYKQTKYRITGAGEAAGTVISASTTGNGAFAVADPRCGNYSPDAHRNKLKVADWDQHTPTVTGGKHVQSGGLSIADPRPNSLQPGRHYETGGHYGVVPWEKPSGAVPSAAKNNNGPWNVADPRVPAALPPPSERLACVIISLDNTWHRPFTTLELACLQSYVDPERLHEDGLPDYAGHSDSAWREWIGNLVPPDAAAAMASVAARALLLARTGETFSLSSENIWVRPVALALQLSRRDET